MSTPAYAATGRRAGQPISKTEEGRREKRRGFYRLLTGKYPTHRKFIR